MMSLIFLLLFCAMLSVYHAKTTLGYTLFSLSVVVSVYWFSHHASDALSILL
ncbi:DUF5993 family protein [Vibrio ostreicida]|uniref:DUF5993 family protein n=1 Tax=Vibrio ostreicida TaxID=526588 RepID=A0ABT8BTC9_9VIBR|nr:DUF5993 family protein [Vibrio ostreicida]MDN3609636.1 DUF5993 family protein [Vibrio ostreicida]NPD09533.1 hypothetical protein [Vibrio ostreicida]